MRSRWMLLLLMVFGTSQGICQDPLPTGAELPLTADRVSQIDSWIAKTREEWDVPGLAVAVVHDGNVVLASGYGVRELGKAESVDADTLFAIASNTKAFTAASIAILADDDKLDWDDRVQKFLPWLQLYDPWVSSELRVDDLLCHRSGLGTFSGDLLWWGTPYTAREVLHRTRHLKPGGSFRAHYGYSNLMFLAAGEIIVNVSGQSWQSFVQDRILTPVGMQRTVTSVEDLALRDNVASPHKPTTETVSPIPWVNWDTMAAAGGIISSVNDMSKWMIVQLNHGRIDDETRLFSEASSRRMWSPHTIIPLSKSYATRYTGTHFRAYGLGWSLSDYKGRKTVSHGGGYDGMYSHVLMVPEEKLGIVVLTNSMTGISPAISYHVLDQYLGGKVTDWSGEGLKRDLKSREQFYDRIRKTITAKAEGTSPTHPLADYTGTFSGDLYGDGVVELGKDGLVLKLLPNPDLVADLKHLHYDTFAIHWRKQFAWFAEGTAQFIMDADGVITEIKLDVPNDDLWFHEVELLRSEE
jgi:CubicO group peptidase (beta-lactamase class C family)